MGAAVLDPEILVIDEVLAVGDAEFQRKCMGKMEDVSRSGRTILVMYTDGADSRSKLNFSDILDMLRASPVTVYAVGLVEHAGRHRMELQMRLTQMVEASGGRAFFPSSLKDLDASYGKVLEEIRAQYQLGYASTNSALDGTWRKVEIKTKRRDVKLRSRQGYFAAYKKP